MGMVKMHHDDPSMTGGPTTADVPEEAVKNWQKAGWYVEDILGLGAVRPIEEQETEKNHPPERKGK